MKKKSEGGKMSKGIIAGVLLAGGALFLAWKKGFAGDKSSTSQDTVHAEVKSPVPSPTIVRKSNRNDNFPLHRGSLGNRVGLLQVAIQNILGKADFPDTEIDNDFGPRTESALVRAKLPVIIDEKTFNSLVSKEPSALTPTNVATTKTAREYQILGSSLLAYARDKNFDKVISVLKQLQNTYDYQKANSYFISMQFFGAKSIVTYLLDDAFGDNQLAKENLRKEFLRIGLVSLAAKAGNDPVKADGGWSLSGFVNEIITITDTYVVEKRGIKIPTKARTLLGNKINAGNGMTWFKAMDGKIYSVPSSTVKSA
jgi:hypothetical protein